MAFKLNKVKIDIRSYPHYVIMGQRKVGKTTLFRDLVKLVFKDPAKGLLISCGNETGYRALDDLNYEEAKVWTQLPDEDGNRGLVEIIDEVISLRNTDDAIEMVCFDTLDELVEVATQQVFEEHRDEKNKYPKSLNEALGGYSAGHKRVASLIKEQIARLEDAHIAVFIMAHTKVKENDDVLSGDKYEMITNSLDSRFYGPIADTAQMVINIVIDRKISGAKTEKKTIKGETVEVPVAGRSISNERVMYFRENPFVDAGGRFEGLPESLPLSAENFMKAFEMGVKASMSQKVSDADLEKQKKAEEKEQKIEAKKAEKQDKLKIVKQIKDALNQSPTPEVIQKVSEKITELGVKSFDEAELAGVSIEDLRSLYELTK